MNSNIIADDKNNLKLKNDLVLNNLSANNKLMDTIDFTCVENIDLKCVKVIDSVGLAYLTQLKILHPQLTFSGCSKSIVLLSTLYGLNFLFSNENENNL
ncbi:MAG: hypothetical protein KAH18_06065 [Psychromonas sp.]|nr:hypothetical protein [Psychromonas sp.]